MRQILKPTSVGRRLALALVVLGALAPLAFAAPKDTIVWARNGDIDSLDPQRATSTLSRMVWYQLYSSLLEFNDQGKLVPGLAKSWKVSPDGKTVTFTLHKGIRCSDGTPFTAQDVKYTAERALSDKNPSLTKASWGPITQVKVIDALTVQFDLSHRFDAFVPFMADQFSGMLCLSDKKAGSKFGTSFAVGTGPWKFVKWVKGSEIVLERNPYYKNYGRSVTNPGPPYMKQLIIKTVPEGQTRYAGLKTGAYNIIQPPIEDIPQIRKSSGMKLVAAKNSGQDMFIEFAVHRPPFNDVKARKAVAYALNIPSALNLVFGNLVQREYCPVARGMFGNDEALCKKVGYSYDPQKARQLLKELGYSKSHPMPIIMMTWKGSDRSKVLQVFQNQLAQVGIQAKIQVMDIGTLNARVRQENSIKTGTDTLDLMGWTWYGPDVLYLLWHSPGAYHGFHTPELDQMLASTRTASTSARRLSDVHQAMTYIIKNAVEIPVYTPGWLWLYAMSSNVQGFKVGAFNHPMFSDVKVQ